MTSEERREARYHRRKSKRQANRLKRSKEVGTLQDVFNYHDMFFYGRKCCTGVRWKQSTQNFELHLFSGTAKRRREVLDGKWKQKKCAHFTISERGKVRPIDAPHIDDRQIHKVFTNEVLIPLYHPGMICDNGASQRGKVQWEICEPAGHTYAGGTMVGYDVAKNQGYFDRMWKMVVAWNVYMVKKFGYPISGISDHAESYRAGYGSNHGDVGQWWPKHGKSMDALRKEVQEILNGETEDDDMDVTRFKELWGEMRKELQDNDASAYSAEAREWATKNGLIAGNGTTVSGEPNCMWGDILTREQFVTVLYRWTQMMGKA